MPSTSKKQHNFMAAIAHSPSFAKKVGVPQSVGSDFVKADKGRKFAKGGDMAKKIPPFMGKETKAEEAKEMKVSAAAYKRGEKAEGIHGKSGMEKPSAYAKGGFTKAADGVAQKGKTKAQRFADGGVPIAANPMAKMQAMRQNLQDRRPDAAPNAFGKMQAVQQAMGARKPAPDSRVNAIEPQNAFAKMQAMKQAMQGRRPMAAETSTPLRGNFAMPPNLREAIAARKPTMTAAGPNPVGGAMKKGGCVKKMAKGGGCEVKGKTKGKYI